MIFPADFVYLLFQTYLVTKDFRPPHQWGEASCPLREFNICTAVFEKPHCGKSLLPFMQSRILLSWTMLSSYSFTCGGMAPSWFLRVDAHTPSSYWIARESGTI